jgi:hypothetical protein
VSASPPIDRGERSPELEIGGPVASSWREQVLTRVAEQRTILGWLLAQRDAEDPRAQALAAAIVKHLDAAQHAALDTGKTANRKRAAISGSTIERTTSHLDAVECDLLRLADDGFRRGQMPSLLAHVRRHLEPEDPRRVAVEQLAGSDSKEQWHDWERVFAAVHAASSKARREVRQIRSFRNTLYATAIALTIATGAMAVVGFMYPWSIPLCFHPGSMVVCPTGEAPVDEQRGLAAPDQAVDQVMRQTANRGDVALIELLGVMAAALAAAVALRNIKGTSSPYSLPIALAVLKLPTGALTALLAVILMRGEFVPGLSALDSSAQILAWAIVFGYAQQILTQLVDRQANTVLENVRSGGTAPTTGGEAPPPAAPPPTAGGGAAATPTNPT